MFLKMNVIIIKVNLDVKLSCHCHVDKIFWLYFVFISEANFFLLFIMFLTISGFATYVRQCWKNGSSLDIVVVLLVEFLENSVHQGV